MAIDQTKTTYIELGMELLSAVLNVEVTELKISEKTIIYNEHFIINLYEFMHLCKKWANTLDRIRLFNSYSINSREDWIGGATCGKAEVLNRYEEIIYESPACITEPEAIFKACEWILKDLEQKGRVEC